jgi:putative resolvase
MDTIERGEIATVVIAHQDRVARFGFDYLEHVAKKNDCDIVVANQQSLSLDQELVHDLVAVVRTFPAWTGCADTRRHSKRHSRTSWATVPGEGHPCRVPA